MKSRILPFSGILSRLPYWLVCLLLLGCVAGWSIFSDKNLYTIFSALLKGLGTTLVVSFFAYGISTIAGLLIGLMRVSVHRVIREIASFYVELIRGIPMLVILFYIAFVAAPAIVQILNFLTTPLQYVGLLSPFTIRSISFATRATIALSIGYSAFIAEIFRAGIESINRGQTEASLALGMSRTQVLVSIILPQAIRNVLPPLGNELIAIIKDSALVSALGVQDITQIGKTYAASTFQFFETYNLVALTYLVLTISLNLLVRSLESYLSSHKHRDSNRV